MSDSPPTDIPPILLPLLAALSNLLHTTQHLFDSLPGSPIILRYIRSSYQNDPWRSLLEVLLVAFAVRTLLKGRTRGEEEGKNVIKFKEHEIDELVDEYQPVPLVEELADYDAHTLDTVPIIHGPNGARVKLSPTGKSVLNMAIPDWTGLVENDKVKGIAIDTLREYGVGSCGPSGFYGTIDVHQQFERDIAEFIGTESAIIYSQSFSLVSSVIPAFAKRGDIIVADRGVNFAIHKGLQLSRCQIKWYAHGDMADLERVLQGVEKERKRRGGKLTKMFIVAEGIFENDGMMLDLPKVIELKKKFKYRLILDESQSFGMIGQHGRGLTEYFGIPATEVDMLLGSMAVGLATGGGFCAGSQVVCKHQRINSSASVFSASLPALLATTASFGLTVLREGSALGTLQSNIALFRHQLLKLEPSPDEDHPNKDALISIPSHPSSALIHIFLLHPPPTLDAEERLLQEIVDEALASSGVLVGRARRLRGQEVVESEPSLKVCVSAVWGRKEVERAGMGVRSAIQKVVGKRR
ncbi:hypothetical protein B9479_006889 [Cryptococcus floricola]|uniref:serine C-palmitoyltransferase n=1 Tax=Cryptococcus floricola TaxID=2591691 RepID=A0A5D3ALX9_9TREE|nr:hypothetical protein B9479_006889 [Cryptococcus floricola]